MNGKQQNTGRGAASPPPKKDGGGMGVEGSGELELQAGLQGDHGEPAGE